MNLITSTSKYIVFSILFISVSCSKETMVEDLTTNEGLKIQDQYKPYVERFFAEAAKRKVDVSDSRLYVITGFPRLDYCGYGYSNYLGNGSMRVEISPDPGCWTSRSDTEREILMFHELGHAVLARQHREGNFSISLPVSMMCSETCNGFFNIYSEFTPELREHYIDELFDPLTPAPSWAIRSSSEIVFEDHLEDLSNEWNFFSPLDSNNIYSGIRLDTIEFDNKALSIRSEHSTPDNTFSFWRKIIKNPKYPVGSGVRLSVDITSDNLWGEGVAIALRSDSKSDDELKLSAFNTTQSESTINGNLQMKEVTVDLNYFPNDVEQLQIFLLMLNKTVGKVYFDNIKLELLE